MLSFGTVTRWFRASISRVFLVSYVTMPTRPDSPGSGEALTVTWRPIHSCARMFCDVIGIYSASSGVVGVFSAVNSLATVRRSSLTLEGFSTVPPDFTDVRIVVSSALSSEIFFFRSSGSICFISRLRSIAIGLLLLGLYHRALHDGCLSPRCRGDTRGRRLHRRLVNEIYCRRYNSDLDAEQALVH